MFKWYIVVEKMCVTNDMRVFLVFLTFIALQNCCVPKGWYRDKKEAGETGLKDAKPMFFLNTTADTNSAVPPPMPDPDGPKINPARWKPQPVPRPNPIPFVRPGHTLEPIDPVKRDELDIKGPIPFVPWYWSTTTPTPPNDTDIEGSQLGGGTNNWNELPTPTSITPDAVEVRCGSRVRGECPRISEEGEFPMACDWSACPLLFHHTIENGYCQPITVNRITQSMVWDSELCSTLCLQMHNCVGFSFMAAAQKCLLETQWCDKGDLTANPYYVSYKKADPPGYGCVYKECIDLTEEVQRSLQIGGHSLDECAAKCRLDFSCKSFSWGPTQTQQLASRAERLPCRLMKSDSCPNYRFNKQSLQCIKVF